MTLKTRKVVIYDAARTNKYKIVLHWRQHVVYALKKHLPMDVLENGLNVVYANTRNIPALPHDMPLWKLEGHVGGYNQSDNFSCGPIALNRFAERLKKYSGGIVSEDGIATSVKTPEELEENNVTNAKDLFLLLLQKRDDAFTTMEERLAESNKQEIDKDKNPVYLEQVMGTPKHSIGTRDDVLFDTPEEADVKASIGKRRLQ